jgi:hypothetical protein
MYQRRSRAQRGEWVVLCEAYAIHGVRQFLVDFGVEFPVLNTHQVQNQDSANSI